MTRFWVPLTLLMAPPGNVDATGNEEKLIREAESGNVQAQSALCTKYLQPETIEQAVPWCRMAAEGGDQSSQYSYGFLIHMGHTEWKRSRESKIAAYMWLQLAATGPNEFTKEIAEQIRNNVGRSLTVDEITLARKMSLGFTPKTMVKKGRGIAPKETSPERGGPKGNGSNGASQ